MIYDIPVAKYNEANMLSHRDCYSQLSNYISGDSTKVCTIYGLRRTGKTTMMFQAMSDIGLNDSRYILCENGDSYGDLCQKIGEYIAQKKKAIFIDEITKIPTFLTASASLADYFSGTVTKIIITGTDSLGLNLVTRGELFDRVESIHTTYISYGEFSRLIRKTDIDDFIHYAGVLSHEDIITERVFFDRSSASHYIDSAISNNITNTFFNKRLPANFIHKYDKLIGLHNRNMLVPVITSIVEMYSGVITKDTLDSYFRQDKYPNADIDSALDLLEKHNIFINRDNFTEDFDAQVVFALNSRQDVDDRIDESTVLQIKEYLSDLEIFVKIPLIRHNSNNPQKEYTYETEEYIYQAGMKYCQAKAVVDIIKETNNFNISPIEKDALCRKIDEDVKGQILETVVFSDFQKFLNSDRYDIFKMQFVGNRDGEIDMVVYDKHEKAHYCFEIKHSDKIDENQQKNLLYDPFLNILSENFGTCKCLSVLYRGKTDISLENGIKYLNVADVLSEIYLSKTKILEDVIISCIGSIAPSNKKTSFEENLSATDSFVDLSQDRALEFAKYIERDGLIVSATIDKGFVSNILEQLNKKEIPYIISSNSNNAMTIYTKEEYKDDFLQIQKNVFNNTEQNLSSNNSVEVLEVNSSKLDDDYEK